MKTTSFRYTGPGRISIARRAPRGHPTGYRIYGALAPGSWFMSVSKEEYKRLFAAQLAALDPQVVWGELHALANNEEPVLMCWENTPLTESNWCHRTLVAEWFKKHGLEVSEMGGELNTARVKKSAPPLIMKQGGQVTPVKPSTRRKAPGRRAVVSEYQTMFWYRF